MSTSQTDLTCGSQIGPALQSFLTDVRSRFSTLDNPNTPSAVRETLEEEWYEEPLDVEPLTVVKILLTFGGPNVWFEIQLDRAGDPVAISYHWAWWGDYAERDLREDELELVARWAEPFLEAARQQAA